MNDLCRKRHYIFEMPVATHPATHHNPEDLNPKLHLYYKYKLVNTAKWKNHCLFCESYVCTFCWKNTEFMNVNTS